MWIAILLKSQRLTDHSPQIMDEEKNDKIVLLRTFDLAIDANLAKTKLDAFGIPCFLNDENLANLYPMRTNFGMGVRLMVFENDVQRSIEILSDQSEENMARCPYCRSKEISMETTAAIGSRLRTILFGLLGFTIPQERRFICRSCEREFELPDNF